jgi:hypothetical protein
LWSPVRAARSSRSITSAASPADTMPMTAAETQPMESFST